MAMTARPTRRVPSPREAPWRAVAPWGIMGQALAGGLGDWYLNDTQEKDTLAELIQGEDVAALSEGPRMPPPR